MLKLTKTRALIYVFVILSIGLTSLLVYKQIHKTTKIKVETVSDTDNKDAKSDIITTEELKNLTFSYGNEESDIVIINTQGGPSPKLMSDKLKEILSPVDSTKYLIVNVHQSQTKNPELFTEKEISFDEAIKYDKESVQDLYEVIKYYKNQNKKVYVLGLSFGAFMTQELIATNGTDIADKYFIMVGRLDIDEVFWKGFSEGKNGYYVDGVNPFLEETTSVVEKNMFKLAAGLGNNRYTKKLDKYDLSKVTYVYANMDEQVGKLTDKEIEFLKSKNATVIEADGGHLDTVMNKISLINTVFNLDK